MKKALIGCAAMLLMLIAVGSAQADHRDHGHHGHHGHGNSHSHGHGHGHHHGRSTVVVRSYAPPVSYRSYGWSYNPVYSDRYCVPYHHHHHHVPVNRSGFYIQFGF